MLSSRIEIPSIAPAGAEVTQVGAAPEPFDCKICPALPASSTSVSLFAL